MTEVGSILSNVKHGDEFHIYRGDSVKNIVELSSALTLMSDAIFAHHVSSSKNDFYNWITHAFGSSGLSKKLKNVSSREKMVDIIDQEIVRAQKKVAGKSEKVSKISKMSLAKKVSLPKDMKKMELHPAVKKLHGHVKNYHVQSLKQDPVLSFLYGIVVGVIVTAVILGAF